MSWRSVGRAECGEMSELNACTGGNKVLLLRCFACFACFGTWLPGYTEYMDTGIRGRGHGHESS